MRARRTLRPVVAASLLAGLVLPAGAVLLGPAFAAPPSETSANSLSQAPAAVRPALPVPAAPHMEPEVRPVRLTRHATTSPYTVRRGDCLWRIAAHRFGNGAKWAAIYEANRGSISNPDLIYPGQELRLPQGEFHAARLPHRVAHLRAKHRVARRNAAQRLAEAFTNGPQAHRGDGADWYFTEVVQPAPKAHEQSLAFTGDVPHGATGPAGDTFQGHHRVGGQFYRMKAGKLVWADDGTPVRGAWSQRVSEQIYPNRQAAIAHGRLQLAAAPQPHPDPRGETPSLDRQSAEELTIQGHHRVNGTFFVLRDGQLVWADTGEPVRPDDSNKAAVIAP